MCRSMFLVAQFFLRILLIFVSRTRRSQSCSKKFFMSENSWHIKTIHFRDRQKAIFFTSIMEPSLRQQ
uniref:Putative secreted protein n=1 Tax=Xenopsylla cheopis TaxID=163159 RepID=A0A6M2DWR9_XENCH